VIQNNNQHKLFNQETSMRQRTIGYKTAFLFAAAVLSTFSINVAAQSSTTLFGLVDLGVESANAGTGSIVRVQSGQWFGSRLGVRGSEDLGGGLSAVYVAEIGITADTGGSTGFGTNATAAGTTGILFDRQVFVGLNSSNLGRLTFGRQYSLTDSVKGTVEPFTNGTAADTSPIRALNPSRSDNAIIYQTPSFGGLTAGVLYSTGTESLDSATTSEKAGRESSVMLAYANGPLYIGAAYDNLYARDALTANRTEVQQIKSWIVGATYDFKVVKLHTWVNGQEADAVGTSTDALAERDTFAYAVGVTVPIGTASNFRVAYAARDDKTTPDRDASKWGIGYFYDLSKRTTLYTAYSVLTNEDRFTGAGVADGAGITLGSGAAAGIALQDRNSDPRSFNLGIRHSF
jgi:general bacterial porin, GBP family